MFNTFKQFEKEALKLGLVASDKGNWHWQVKGKLIVNYYPSRGTIYIAGTTKGTRQYDVKDLFKYCQELPEIQVIADRKQYTGAKRKLWKKSPFCWLCQKKLLIHEATIDHFIPLSKGGLNNSNNYRLACEPCNIKRGNKI